jgi:hypothetical protein
MKKIKISELKYLQMIVIESSITNCCIDLYGYMMRK